MTTTNPTPYDTGVRLEPKPWVNAEGIAGEEEPRPAVADDYGRVDFDDADLTAATVWIEPGVAGGYLLQVDAHVDDLDVTLSDSPMVALDPVLVAGLDELVHMAERGRTDFEDQDAATCDYTAEDRAEADRRWALAQAAVAALRTVINDTPNSTVSTAGV